MFGRWRQWIGRPAAETRRVRPAPVAPSAGETDWRPSVKRRALIVLVLIGLWGIAIQARLVHLQVVQHADLHARAERQQQGVRAQPAERGEIVDRHGQLLAFSVDAEPIAADPSLIDDAAGTVGQLCDAFGDCTPREREELLARLSRDGQYVALRSWRQVTPDQARRVRALDLPGVIVERESRRFYPRFDLAAHLLGFVGTDNRGLAGVESVYDAVVRGREGVVIVQKDARAKRLMTRVERPPTAGATLELTIDLQLQHVAERELQAGVELHGAAGGTVVVMDPMTGEILALANAPTFNPNAHTRFPQEAWRNRALQEIYEPGSTFKIVTAAAALEEGLMSPTEIIDVSPGYITIPGRPPISDEHRYGLLSFEDVIVKSSNVGAIKVGLDVGADRLSRYVRRFGFGEILSPDFAGQSRGIVHDAAALNQSAIASISMGYQVSVTPLQMATAMSAIANGGELVEPRLVRAIIRDGVREDVEPKVLRRAISRETAATLTAIMENVVVRGTARAARLDRYQVAGKTGTSKKAIPGGYSATDRHSSFVGFVPSRRPAFTILVVIDTPRRGQVYGGAVAAPVFRNVAEAALRLYGVPATINPEPPVVLAASRPPAATPVRATAIIPAVTPAGGRLLMPDLRGLGGRAALNVLIRAGLQVRLDGSGVVVDHTPAPGEPIEPGAWSVLYLRRTAAEPSAGGGGR